MRVGRDLGAFLCILADMGFSEILASLQATTGEGTPATVFDDLRTAFDDETSNAAAKVAEQTERIAFLETEISRLKSANYDLMIERQSDTTDVVDVADGNADDNVTTIDDLFNRG